MRSPVWASPFLLRETERAGRLLGAGAGRGHGSLAWDHRHTHLSLELLVLRPGPHSVLQRACIGATPPPHRYIILYDHMII